MKRAGSIFSKSRRTILVVDDDIAVRKQVCAVLGQEHLYNILLANTGASAIQESKQHKGDIHLLLSDFQMRGMSGVD